ncbi:hypothetical protein [Chitinophaga rhizophila]|uniref:Uncharacterized protein n=1 Tax=Chitinophaga rhizophila TaxID=2866212 RepID=A0ABS7GD20_9BACT|nr:hypothetical protein [Chitinophaga rhizophila]MBW8685570.1 hypothetical protein [Chitinophaga rhizophila]
MSLMKVFGCRLLFPDQPVIDYPVLLEELRKYYHQVEAIGNTLFNVADDVTSAQYVIMPAVSVGEKGQYEMLVNDVMGDESREAAFRQFMEVIVGVVRPGEVCWL